MAHIQDSFILCSSNPTQDAKNFGRASELGLQFDITHYDANMSWPLIIFAGSILAFCTTIPSATSDENRSYYLILVTCNSIACREIPTFFNYFV